MARVLTALIVIASSWGLLSMPIGDYDDSLLVVGSRLVEAGRLPYLDFYSHYGPLGYTLFGGFTRWIGNSGLALRITQGLLLSLVAAILHAAARRSRENPDGDEGLVPIAVMTFSGVAAFPSVPGVAAAAAAILLFAISVRSKRRSPRAGAAVASGVLLGIAILIRPSFGLYAGVAIVLAGLLFGSSREACARARLECLGMLLATTLATGLLLWILLYRMIPVSTAFKATILVPSRLMGGGSRYLDPGFLNGPVPQAIVVMIALAAATCLWTFALGPSDAKAFSMAACAIAALLPLVLHLGLPGRPLPELGFLYFPIAVALVFAHRTVLCRDGSLAASAVVGLGAAAFLHYFWSRADGPHILPALALAAGAAALAWGRLGDLARVGALAVLFLGYAVAAHGWYEALLPAARVSKTTIVRTPAGRVLPCERLPEDPRNAAAFADRLSNAGSRFVAIASSHAVSQSDPVVLFAASRRLPYSRWFQYDPGLQSSPAVQSEMERELEASDSEAAVVWRADRFLVDREKPTTWAPTRLDSVFERFYPRTVARFGDYEVRLRDKTPPRAP